MIKIYTKEILQEAVKNADSFSDVLRYFNKPIHGGSVDYIKKKLAEFEIDTSHFTGRRYLRSRKTTGFRITKEQFIDDFLKENGRSEITDRLKKKILYFGLLEHKCAICGNEGIWNNKPLTLQIDHINGKRLDNRLENLRIMCPNCHSQTDTYSGKKNGG